MPSVSSGGSELGGRPASRMSRSPSVVSRRSHCTQLWNRSSDDSRAQQEMGSIKGRRVASSQRSRSQTTGSELGKVSNTKQSETLAGEELEEEQHGDDSWVDIEEEQEKNRDVVFRFVNSPQDSRRCNPTYETFSAFDPDPETLARMTLFRHYISVGDFETLLEASNLLIGKYRDYSKRWLFLLIFASFGAVFMSIFLHYGAGITFQLVVLIIYMCAQSHLKKSCPSFLNDFLTNEVNEPLIESRGVYLKCQCATNMCSTWLELDICKQQKKLDSSALRERDIKQYKREKKILQQQQSQQQEQPGTTAGTGDSSGSVVRNPMLAPSSPTGLQPEALESEFSDLGVKGAPRGRSGTRPERLTNIQRWRETIHEGEEEAPAFPPPPVVGASALESTDASVREAIAVLGQEPVEGAVVVAVPGSITTSGSRGSGVVLGKAGMDGSSPSVVSAASPEVASQQSHRSSGQPKRKKSRRSLSQNRD